MLNVESDPIHFAEDTLCKARECRAAACVGTRPLPPHAAPANARRAKPSGRARQPELPLLLGFHVARALPEMRVLWSRLFSLSEADLAFSLVCTIHGS
jgi:hypothetical protein